MNITSRKNSHIQYLRALQKEKKLREQDGLFVIEGPKLAFEAIKSGFEITSAYITEDARKKYTESAELIKKHVDIDIISSDISEYISDTKAPQGVFVTAKIKTNKLSDAVSCGRRFLVLDRLQDAGNVGTIIRTCDAFSLGGIIVSEDCADVYSPKTVRSTMGSIFRVPVFRYSLVNSLDFLANNGYNVYAAMLDSTAERLDKVEFPQKTAVVIGNEGNGISDEVAAHCNKKIYIPMNNAESLNAAVAASVICWELRKQEG